MYLTYSTLHRLLPTLAFMLVLPLACAQTVTITGTVVDNSGHIYQKGSGVASLVSGNGSGQQQWLINNTNPVPTPISFNLDSFGKFSISLTNTSLISPGQAAPSWQFSINSAQPPACSPQVSFIVPALALTSSQDISTQIQAVAAPLPPSCGGSYINLSSPPPIGNVTPNAGAFTTLTATTFTPTTEVVSDLSTSLFPVIDVRAYGAVGDGVAQNGCSITAGQHTVTCSDSRGRSFPSTVVGKLFGMTGAGGSDGYANALITTVTGWTSGSSITISAAAVNTVTGTGQAWAGTDNYAAFCAATQCTTALYTGNYNNGVLAGRELYAPGGTYLTSGTLYTRNNMSLRGNDAGTQIVLISNTHLLAGYGSINDATFNTANITPVICASCNASAGANTSTSDSAANYATGSTAVHNVLTASPLSRTPGILVTSFGNSQKTGGVLLDGNWTEDYYGWTFWHTNIYTATNSVCDEPTVCALVMGDGTTESSSGTYGGQIVHNQIGGSVGVLVAGGNGLLIEGNDFNYVSGNPILESSADSFTTYRMNVSNNDIEDYPATSFHGTIGIQISSPCVDCKIHHNQSHYLPSSFISIDSAVTNLLIDHNLSYHDADITTAAAINIGAAGDASGNVILDTNVFESPGYYGVFSANVNVKADNNFCNNPFTIASPLSVNAYQSACLYFSGSSGSTIEASNNTVTASGSTNCGSVCPAVNTYSSGANIKSVTWDNTSPYHATCDVCHFSGQTGSSLSYGGEVATNSGSSTTGLFRSFGTYSLALTGGATIGSTLGVTGAATFSKQVSVADEGNCTLSTGACTAQSLSTTYTTAPTCICTWNGTGTLTGILSCPSTTTTVTPHDSVSGDTGHINWACFGN